MWGRSIQLEVTNSTAVGWTAYKNQCVMNELTVFAVIDLFI